MGNMALLWEHFLTVFKYLLAIFMMIVGVATMFIPPDSTSSLGIIYESHVALVIFGLIFFASGATLLYGKVRRRRMWTGRGLMAIALCFLFGTLLQAVGFGLDPSNWLPNFIAFLIVGALWLRWRMKTAYINPKHFVDDVKELSS